MWDSAPRAKLSCGLISSSESLLGEDGWLRVGLQKEKGMWTSSTLQPHAFLLQQEPCKVGFPYSQFCPIRLSQMSKTYRNLRPKEAKCYTTGCLEAAQQQRQEDPVHAG